MATSLENAANRGVANTGLGFGIAGTALALLSGGGGLFGGCRQDLATKTDLNYVQEIARKDSEIALLRSEQNTEVKIADVFERVMARINADQKAQSEWNALQSVNNAKFGAAIAQNSSNISALQSSMEQITKVVIPNSAICPGWGSTTTTITPTTNTTDTTA